MKAKVLCGKHAGAIYQIEMHHRDPYRYELSDLSGNRFFEPENNCELLEEETEMKVMALTNGFMRKKGEWYVVRDSLTNCYIIETGKTLTCVLKTDFITELDYERQQAIKRVLNKKYGTSYQDTDSLLFECGNLKNVGYMVLDWDKVHKLSEKEQHLLYSVLTEVKA